MEKTMTAPHDGGVCPGYHDELRYAGRCAGGAKLGAGRPAAKSEDPVTVGLEWDRLASVRVD
jgi:hypothetical protein